MGREYGADVKIVFWLALIPFLPLIVLMPPPEVKPRPRYSGGGSEGELVRIGDMTKEQREELARFWSYKYDE